MIDGLVLAGDHSHKIAKLIFVAGDRAFEGLYTLVNGYGQVVGFWFVHGTTLREVEPMLRGVARRVLKGLATCYSTLIQNISTISH